AVIDEAHLGLAIAPAPPFDFPGVPGVPIDGLGLKDLVRRATIAVERTVLVRVLKETGGNKAKAARLLRIDYKTIHTKLKEYGIAVRGGEGDGQA
ncbi:MAG: helix-turn-helix domain-containing protein, partial [Candidatus Deferrimicrobium sp.]|nr:helix-turn-helix domain-containing protein [Candidatus Deferrimicrobium sp.]